MIMDLSHPISATLPSGPAADIKPASNRRPAEDAAARPASVAPAREPSREELQQAVESVRQAVDVKAPNELTFAIDQDSGRSLVRIIDQKTGALIRQIPSAEMLLIAKDIDKLQGRLLHQAV